MRTVMAESYFKDPLLAKWLAVAHPDTQDRAQRNCQPDDGPLSVLEHFARYHYHGGVMADRDRLSALILAELSGARRAREKAEQLTSHKYLLGAYPNGGLVKIGAERAAREILEAFDGE